MRVKGELKNAEVGRPNKPMKLPVACGARSFSADGQAEWVATVAATW